MNEKIMQSLQLQKLVKEKTKGISKSPNKFYSDEIGYHEQELLSLLKESEK